MQNQSQTQTKPHIAVKPHCTSYRKSLKEIDEERRRSGWNPYVNEEEDSTPEETNTEETNAEDNALAFAMEAERDLRMLQSMFPGSAKILMPYIEEECDKMEYEGSMMFDEYPDAEALRKIQEKIYNVTADQFPLQPRIQRDEMLVMQSSGRGQDRPGRNWVSDLIRILLLQEMHHRRCRKKECGRMKKLVQL